jgi:hypothetical protein
MTDWHALILACAVSGILGFAVVRLGAAMSRGRAFYRDLGGAVASVPAPTPPHPAAASAGPTRARHHRGASERAIARGSRAPRAQQYRAQPVPRLRASLPAPSVVQPDDRRLALWAREVAAGTRKMSLATDGCRVTWNRRCKHGHPSWLVYLEYISPDSWESWS